MSANHCHLLASSSKKLYFKDRSRSDGQFALTRVRIRRMRGPRSTYPLRKIVYRDRGLLLEGFWKRSIFRHTAGQSLTIYAAHSFRDKKTLHTRSSAGDKNSYVNARSALFLISRKRSNAHVIYGLQKVPKKERPGIE